MRQQLGLINNEKIDPIVLEAKQEVVSREFNKLLEEAVALCNTAVPEHSKLSKDETYCRDIKSRLDY
jgi:hypothetical protein